jgi:hypothetical protein
MLLVQGLGGWEWVGRRHQGKMVMGGRGEEDMDCRGEMGMEEEVEVGNSGVVDCPRANGGEVRGYQTVVLLGVAEGEAEVPIESVLYTLIIPVFFESGSKTSMALHQFP